MPETTTTTARTSPDGKGIPPAVPPTKEPPPASVLKNVTVVKKKKKMNPWVIVAGVLLLAAALWFFFFRSTETTKVTVRYTAVETGDITKGITATGTLQATTTVQVGSQVSGTIRKLYADFNSHVEKGQILAELDPSVLEQSLTQAQSNLSKAQADLDLATKDEARQRDLLQRQLIAKADYEVSQNKLRVSQATVRQQEASVSQAKTNLSYTTIRSPISGTVVSRNIDEGQTVAASLNAPTLFLIAQDLSSMQVAANVDEADIGQVVEGQQVKFTVDAFPGQAFQGTVHQVRINPVTTQNVVTYTVIILTDNPGGKLLPGMTATVNIISASKPNVLRIPTSATRFTPPAELLSPQEVANMKKDSATRFASRRPRATTDTVRRGQMDRPVQRTIYIKSKSANGAGTLTPVRVVLGLSDGAMTEVVSSNPPLQPGDSIAVAAIMPSTTGAPSAPASNPLGGGAPGGMRGMGGAGGGGGRGGR